jgi:hypothetical protein
LLTDITLKAFPDTFGLKSTEEVIKGLHLVLESKMELPAVFINQDLAGFFTSVPQNRIIEALQFTLDKYFQLHPIYLSDGLSFTVELQPRDHKCRVFRGSYRKSTNQQREFWVDDIVRLARFALDSSQFSCMDQMFAQIQGSPMGSPPSPVLCSLVALHREHIWLSSYQLNARSEALWLDRYADNRFCILKHNAVGLDHWNQFLDESFYEHPIVLETLQDTKVLGFDLNIEARTLTYAIPPQLHCYRHKMSAGSNTILLSGLRSRITLIKRLTFPKQQVRPSINKLLNMYKQLGFNDQDLQSFR